MLKNKNSLRFLPLSLIFLLIIFYMPCLSGQQYYADILIDVDSSGFVTIEGSTNHPDLLIKDTEQYTSKKQSYWLLNITKDDIFSEYVFVVSFPEDSSINFIGSDGSIRIEEEQGDLIVKGFGENKTFSVIVQYQIEKVDDSAESNGENQITNILLLIIIFISIITLVFLNYSKFFKKPDENFEDVKDYNLKGLNERQKKIMELLIERKRPLTQTEIQKELKIPKAAVSRNIRTLQRKGLIEKEQTGMSNLITLKKQ